jgi:membrane protein DedA with SNARE-associated domain
MSLETLVNTYGYLALLLGTFLEGETVLVLGGVAAQRGFLHLPWVILAAFAGTFCGDQLFFFLGRRHSGFILNRRPAWRSRIEQARNLIDRYQTPVIIGFRFLYGLRSVIPFAIGLSSVPFRRFFFLNLAGALVWAATVGTGGYLFGHGLELILGDLERYEHEVMGAVALAGFLVWAFFRIKRHYAAHRVGPTAPETGDLPRKPGD